MDSNYSYIDFAIEELELITSSLNPDLCRELRGGLKFLKTFLVCVTQWSNADANVHLHLGDLVIDIEEAFAKAGIDLSDAFEGGEKTPNNVSSELLGNFGLFKLKISEAYDYLAGYSSRPHSCSPITDFHVWNQIINAMDGSLMDLIYKQNLTGPLKRETEAFREKLRSLHLLLLKSSLSSLDKLPDFQRYLGVLVICAARLSHLCWVNRMDANKSQDLIDMLSDLQKTITPCTPEIVETHFRFLKAVRLLRLHSDGYMVGEFVEFLLPKRDLREKLSEGLIFLVKFLINTPEEFANDVELISVDIKHVIKEAGSLNFSSPRRRREAHIGFFQLLGKVEVLKIEAVLMQLINHSTKDKVPAKKTSETLHKGVRFLQTFLNRLPREISDKGKLILTHIDAVADGVGSLDDSFQMNQITEHMIRDALKLLVNIKLLKAELLWLELSHCYANFKDQIDILYEGLELLRKFVSGPPNENSETGKLILTHVEEVASQAISLYYSVLADEVTEDLVKEMNHSLPNLQDKINLVKAEVKDIYLQVRSLSAFNFPKTDGSGFVDFFLENSRKMLSYKAESIDSVKHQIEVVQRDLELLRSFVKDTAENCNEHPELEDLRTRIIRVTYEADYVIDSIVLRNGAVWYHMLCLSDVIEEIKLIKAQVTESNEKKKYAIEVKTAAETLRHRISEASSPEIKEVIIDLKDQEEIIIDRLTRGSQHRDIISIVGMAGIGKTTLAKKVYNDLNVEKHFHLRAWCCVSQIYQKRDLLLEIFSFVREPTDQVDKATEEDIADLLRKRLIGKKYLIVMDDLWDIQAWNDLQISFPDNENGSRVLFTSRELEVALEAKGDSDPHPLRLLSDLESWKLLEEKLFHKRGCPEDLEEVGKRIANGCKGLPLAIVAIAGVLKRAEDAGWWKQIAEDINTFIAEDPESRCMDILELSYKHLPDNLKPCFLYFGAFSRGKEILVQELLRLWIAEGFIIKDDPNSSAEDIAEIYLMDLIRGSLVIVTKEKSQGGVKACRVHDMLHKLCVSKAEEEYFLQPQTGYDIHFPSSSYPRDYGVDSDHPCPSNSISYEQHRLSICSKRKHFVMLKPSGSRVRSLLFFATSDAYPRCPYDVSFICHNFKLLRVLNLESINMGNSFPAGIELLKQLRYLTVSGDIDRVPSSIANLWNLETFCVKGLKGEVKIPEAIWSMASLRHLHVLDTANFSFQDKSSSKLDNLVSLSVPSFSCVECSEKIMRRFPRLQNLRCIISKSQDHSGHCNRAPIMSFLTHLESLKITYYGGIPNSCEFHFPSTLKKLNLSNFHLPRNYISKIGTLPNLKVLKLLSTAFDEQRWDMTDEEFGQLEHLTLDTSKISEWNFSSDHLPKLRRLVLRSCKNLQGVPDSLAEIATLQMIELKWCSQSAENSVKEIGEKQLESGNTGFKLFINLQDWDFRSLA